MSISLLLSKSGRRRCEIDLGEVLLRKEVIQPHLPVRLPCYDFTPVTNTTLGPRRVLQVFLASMV